MVLMWQHHAELMWQPRTFLLTLKRQTLIWLQGCSLYVLVECLPYLFQNFNLVPLGQTSNRGALHAWLGPHIVSSSSTLHHLVRPGTSLPLLCRGFLNCSDRLLRLGDFHWGLCVGV